MRTLSPNLITQALSSNRVISASLALYKTLLEFTEASLTDGDLLASIGADTEDSFLDSDQNGDYVMRLSGAGSPWTLRYSYNALAAGTWYGWNDSSIQIFKGSRPGIYGTRVFYQGSDGNCYYRDYTPGAGGSVTFGSPTAFSPSIQSTSRPAAFAPISSTVVYVITPSDMHALSGNFLSYVCRYDTGASSEKLWRGNLFDIDESKTKSRAWAFDAVTYDGTDYLFLTDKSKHRVMVLKYFGEWSDLFPAIPIDIVDDTAVFDLGGASLVNSRFVLTGGVRRQSATQGMEIYLFNPEHLTQGRDIFIKDYPNPGATVSYTGNDYETPQWPGKMYYRADTREVWYVGACRRFWAKATVLIADPPHADTYGSTGDINNIDVSCQANSPSVMRFDAAADLVSSVLLSPNCRADLTISVNGQTGFLGSYNIDAKIRTTEPSGSDFPIVARSDAGKKLGAWRSDADFDYWSQAKQSCNPAELSEMIRTVGFFTTENDVLALQDHNKGVTLYSVMQPGRNGIARGTFQIPYDATSVYVGRVGVCLNYYRETAADAAERLGIETSGITSDRLGYDALMLAYSDTDGLAGAPGFKLLRTYPDDYSIDKQWESTIAQWSATLTRGVDYDIMLEHNEGYLRALYKASSSAIWILLGAVRAIDNMNGAPWVRDQQVGRGAIYMKNITSSFSQNGLNSTDLIIGIPDPGLANVGESILLDSEVFTIGGKSNDRGYQFNFECVKGYTLDGATHPNAYTGPFAGYEIYAEEANNGYGLEYAHDYFNGCALVVLSGPGKGNTFKVTDYDYAAPHQWVPTDPNIYVLPDTWLDHVGDPAHGSWQPSNMARWFVETDPSGRISPGSVLKIVPAFYISERGAGDTTAGSHSSSAIAHIYRDLQVQCKSFDYYSGEPDMTIEWMAAEIAGKAGVTDVSGRKLRSGTHDYTRTGRNINLDIVNAHQRRNAIVRLKPTSWTGDIGIIFGAGETILTEARGITVTKNGYVKVFTIDDTYETNLHYLPIDEAIDNQWITFSVQQEYELDHHHYTASVWIDNHLVASFPVTHTSQEAAENNDYMYITVSDSAVFEVDWPELDQRVDNFIMERGKNGASLLQTLIGQKPIYYTMDNGLYLFKTMQTVNSGSPYQLAVAKGDTISDTEVITRAVMEGIDIVDSYDYDGLKTHGNLFAVGSSYDANNIWEMQDDIERLIEEAVQSYNASSFKGAADPRIEPKDKIVVNVPSEEYADERTVIVDGVSFSLRTAEDTAEFDMDITGRNT